MALRCEAELTFYDVPPSHGRGVSTHTYSKAGVSNLFAAVGDIHVVRSYAAQMIFSFYQITSEDQFFGYRLLSHTTFLFHSPIISEFQVKTFFEIALRVLD